jgi:hypothetical protein
MKTIQSIFYALLLTLLSITVMATGKDSIKYWKFEGIGSLNFSQMLFTYWSTGGATTYTVNTFLNSKAAYNKDKTQWENTLNVNYMWLKQDKNPSNKGTDKVEIASKFGHKASKKWLYSSLLNITTQCTPTYSYKDNIQTKESNLLAPISIIYSVGMDYQPVKWFSCYISVLSGSFKYVQDPSLTKKLKVDSASHYLNEFGGYAKIKLEKEIFKNVVLNTKLDLFSNFKVKPENLRINWENIIALKVNKYLSSNINTMLIYDENTPVKDKDGNIVSKKIQFREVFGVGLSYKF